LLIVAGVVFGTDAIMNFIKEFFGSGQLGKGNQ
jgi:hypothetical protein